MSDSVESSRKRKWCPHCKDYVSRATYFWHLALSTSSSATSSYGLEDDSDASENDATDACIEVAGLEAANDALENIAADGSCCSLTEGTRRPVGIIVAVVIVFV